jgi:hypothetical protein
VIIIASGNYIKDEMAAELGRIPPAFLPVGNRRLYEHQVSLLKGLQEEIVLTLPCDFEVPVYDQYWLGRAGVTVIKVDSDLALGESLVQVFSQILGSKKQTCLCILFGDTLFPEISSQDDVYSIGYQEEYYPWGVAIGIGNELKFTDGVESVDLSSGVLSGWFKLSSVADFFEALSNSNGSFFNALTQYAKNNKMNAIEFSDWLDFGHLHTYFHSKAKRTTERSFNTLRIQNRRVLKKSEADSKLAAEANWFENIPSQLRLYTPIYLGKNEKDTEVSYETEYMYLSTLSELFVHGRLPDKVWTKIFLSSYEFLQEASSFKPTEDINASIKLLLVDKALSRIESIALDEALDINLPVVVNGKSLPSVSGLAEMLISNVIIKDSFQCLMHGDFCFSNIMYDFRVGSIKLIDPRGTLDGETSTVYGDLRYDCAKFFHSIVGYYDLIVAGRYTITNHGNNEFDFLVYVDERQVSIKDLFLESSFSLLISTKEAYIHTILLFLSMVPLHSDSSSRQLALLLNAYRLYIQYEDLK